MNKEIYKIDMTLVVSELLRRKTENGLDPFVSRKNCQT